ncbi:MAG: LysR family transcriptional regulator [Treponema sp.]|jgi:lysyl-tRNA synthetase class 2|nr:LysR family transcriptional regulator [Treponema sp.]
MDIELLRERARIIRMVRSFFDQRQYLETDTPLLAPDLIPESCLEVFETLRLPPKGSRKEAQSYWLIPSPEIWMKKLIAQHKQSVYQICKCFRNGESSGHFHSPEFTMLEYYTIDADYKDSLRITEELFSFLCSVSSPFSGDLSDLQPPFEKISMEDAFIKWAGFSLFDAANTPGAMEREAKRLGLNPMPGLDVSQLYDIIFIHTVEPNLPRNKPIAILDYPAFVPCLAKKSSDNLTVGRWELYANGLELANCFTEETRPDEVRQFFINENAEKDKNALIRHKVDDDYWRIFKALENKAVSGVALGLDRLIMLLTGRATIDGILPFAMD